MLDAGSCGLACKVGVTYGADGTACGPGNAGRASPPKPSREAVLPDYRGRASSRLPQARIRRVAILSYRQAQARARERMVHRAHAAAGKHGPLTVRDVVEGYLEWLEGNRKSAVDARHR